MSLKERIQNDVKTAMRAGERERLGALRLILAAVKQREVDERITLDDAQVLAVLEKMVKQRRESVASFEAGGRADLVAKETAELQLIQSYLPTPLSESELDALIGGVMAETGASSIKDMSKVMAAVKAKAAGRADMAAVAVRIKARLG